jgi:hypothetical protein
MPPRNRSRARRIQNREGILLIAVILWIVGFGSEILGAIALPGTYGSWSLALAGLLLIIMLAANWM